MPAILLSEQAETLLVLTIGIIAIAAINSAADSLARYVWRAADGLWATACAWRCTRTCSDSRWPTTTRSGQATY
jgi:hypothetical protein